MTLTNLWSQSETDLLKKLWRKGIKIPQIAKQLGRTTYSIESKVKRMRLENRTDGRKKTPPPNKEIDLACDDDTFTVPFDEITKDQCWFMRPDNTRDFNCCGAPVYKNHLCKKHYILTYGKE